tara:strand:- start:18464 stop:18880 length:417 start_codon:yes stop_codon:yes gene_type:complete
MEKQSNKIEINEYFVPKCLSRPLADGVHPTGHYKSYEYLVNWEGYQMLVVLTTALCKNINDMDGLSNLNYESDSYIGSRCAYYLTDNGEIDMKFTMKKGEGSFMTSVLEGDVLGAIRRGSQEYREILCDAIKERRLNV